MSLELHKIPYPDWREKYNKLMKDKYLSKKYNRKKRIRDKRRYMTEYTPELKVRKGKLVLDIGPGMCEWLEICREFGHNVIGIDARIEDCSMGDEYIQMSKLMSDRQEIPVQYIGFENYLAKPSLPAGSVFYINSQGNINQVFKQYLIGPRHRDTKDSSLLAWNITQELRNVFHAMISEFERLLEDGGYFILYANGSANNHEYDNLVLNTVAKFPCFQLYRKDGKTFHKYCKTG